MFFLSSNDFRMEITIYLITNSNMSILAHQRNTVYNTKNFSTRGKIEIQSFPINLLHDDKRSEKKTSQGIIQIFKLFPFSLYGRCTCTKV